MSFYTEMTEQQNHLQQVLQQQQGLISEINDLNSKVNSKREMLMKLQGVAEYLQQIGVTLPEPEPEVEAETEEPASEEE